LWSRLKPFLLLAVLPVGGCGFTPLYGQSGNSTVAAKLDTIEVQNIPERAGQMLRLALETQLHADGAPSEQLYSLAVSYGLGAIGVGEQQDSSYTRERFNGSAHWSLTPIGTPGGHPLAQGTVTTEDALNIIDEQYFALQLETTTIDQQVADQLAAQITSRVATYFKTHPKS
jgi:LPS-assembly lipoprotein